ncbi:MAG: tRNA (adenosine(37)-N6)-threonylcarbamoyltransferase complex dimerization subunit type 1 TsaB, partial [Pseudomonadota bacterium]
TQILLPMIDDVLAQAAVARTQLDAIAFVAGPGSFTGIRIATSVAQGLSVALNIPVIPLSSLLVLACGAHKETNRDEIFACLDARREQLYWAHYSFSGAGVTPKTVIEDSLSPAQTMVAALEADAIPYGTGVPSAYEQPANYPHAIDGLDVAIERLTAGSYNAPGEAEAVYFRRGL